MGIKIVYLILTSRNVINRADEEIQRTTFGQSNKPNVYWLKGELNLNSPKLSHLDRTLSVPIEETQENILGKTILGIKWLLENEKFDILVRTNVSSYFCKASDYIVKRFNEANDPIFGGFLERHSTDYMLQTKDKVFVTGSGIFLNQRACELLQNCDVTNYLGVPDDIAISHFLRLNGSKMLSIRRGNMHLTGVFIPIFYMRLKSSIAPERTRMRMKRVHSFYTAPNKIAKTRCWFALQYEEIRYIIASSKRRQEILKNFLPSKKMFLLNYFRRITGYQGKVL